MPRRHTQGTLLHHSKVRQTLFGRDPAAIRSAHSHHGALRTWLSSLCHRHRHPARQQWLAHSSNKVASRVLCFFLSGVFAGCSSSTPPEEALADIRQEMRRGELDLAFRHAEAEYQRYARRDSLWAWHFRVQKAHVLVVRGSYFEALQLLSDELPA